MCKGALQFENRCTSKLKAIILYFEFLHSHLVEEAPTKCSVAGIFRRKGNKRLGR